ncbi:MAG: cobyrinate a,c-diamide synthase [Ferrovum sp.]|jgi:cobyrinic acid a,c-diamide synthase|nr:cobyrinate a,c-diamide synthase [Ferrovum sp.]NDU89128.1 cobyrinate a,c-diamide synthase [Ferrovum sp.]
MTRALFISAPASGQGKTLITAALAWHHRQQGQRVRIFKTGPDFLDPMILTQASGHPVGNLDLFMGGEEECRHQVATAALDADLILVEGVMGLFDGTPSSADLAALLGLPVLAVMDASAMAQTFGALALGLKNYDARLDFAGVLANRVGSPRHARLLASSLPASLTWWGSIMRDPALTLPERHLGLVQAAELPDLEERLTHAALALPEALRCFDQLPSMTFPTPAPSAPPERFLDGLRIAIARDHAFSFLYPANLSLLRTLGAQLTFFSPLRGELLPSCDALWLPGGYPELHLKALAAHFHCMATIRQHHEAGKPILAECGGMTYLTQRLISKEGDHADLVGLIPGEATVQPRLAALGLQSLHTPQGELRGHTFHYSRLETTLPPATHAQNAQNEEGEAVYCINSLTATYLHSYFPSNPRAVAQFFLGNTR